MERSFPNDYSHLNVLTTSTLTIISESTSSSSTKPKMLSFQVLFSRAFLNYTRVTIDISKEKNSKNKQNKKEKPK